MRDAAVRRTLPDTEPDLRNRFAGVLLGTALGDALGLPMEGMSAAAVARAFPRIDRFRLLGDRGFVSDDTEQSALVAQSLARHPRDLGAFLRAFRRSLLGWFLRLPWGIGWGTLRACLKIGVGVKNTGGTSAGNGAAMRATILGAFFFDAPVARRSFGEALARVTHADPRAVEAARFVGELTANAVRLGTSASPASLVDAAARVVRDRSLRSAIERADALARRAVPLDVAAAVLGTTGFAVHTIGIVTFCLLRFGHDPELAMVSAVRAGGDTDSNAAIVGAIVGARFGARALPLRLVDRLHDGPFGKTHLVALARDLEVARNGAPASSARYSPLAALLRNLALYPVVLAHAFRVYFWNVRARAISPSIRSRRTGRSESVPLTE